MRWLFVLSILSFNFVSNTSLANGGSTTVGPGSPADIFCEEIRGTTVPATSQRGDEYSLCAVGAAYVESWTLYRQVDRQKPQQALQAYIKHPAAKSLGSGNPAASYCQQVSGKIVILSGDNGNELGLCQFSDFSMIEIWTLFNGPKLAKHRQFNNLLKTNK